MSEIQTYEEGDLKIEIAHGTHLIQMKWLGKCTMKNPSLFLDPIIDEEYELSQRTNKKVIFDFTKFSYMNSSAIIPIIKILKRVRDGRGYVHVHYDKEEKWQKIILGELKVFETTDGRIQIKGV